MTDADALGISSTRLAALRRAAQEARPSNYSPYSNFMVLAAVESPAGVFGGTNVENVNFTLTKHAEETAMLAALAAGAGPAGPWLQTLYVTGASCCGSCRQFAAEFGGAETLVLIDRIPQRIVQETDLEELDEDSVEPWLLRDLLPAAFNPKEIEPDDV